MERRRGKNKVLVISQLQYWLELPTFVSGASRFVS